METLKIKTRDKKTNLDFLRKNGEIPGVFYGKTEKSTPISVLSKDFVKTWKIAGESSVVEIKMPDGTSLEALIYNVDIDPVTENPRHVDFYVFENIVYLLNNMEPNIKEVEGVSPEMVWLALEKIKKLRPDFELSHEVKMYIRFSFKNEGLIFLPPLAQMENPNLKEVQKRVDGIKKGKDPNLDDIMDIQALKFLRIKEYIK